MEKRRLEKERKIGEKGLEREQETKLQSEKLAAHLERENIEGRAEVQSAASIQAGQENVVALTKFPHCLVLGMGKITWITVYCERFRSAKPEGQESPSQLIARIRNYFNQWVELSEVGKTFEGVKEFMLRENFTNSDHRDVSIFLKEQKPRNLVELAQKAEQYWNAHNRKLSFKTTVARKDVRDNKLAGSRSLKDVTYYEMFCVGWQRTQSCRLS